MFADGQSQVAALKDQIAALEKDNRRLEAALAELSRKESTSNYLAYHDGLTDLPNRRLLMDRFQQATANADRHQKHVALLFLDLNRFKRVNDQYGHSTGDKVLQAVAGRIQLMVRATDTACRYGGDEFAIMMPDLENATIAANVAEKIQDRLAYPYEVDDASIFLQSSFGISIYPRDGIVWDTLLRHADAAMYRSKATHLQYAKVPEAKTI
jgi:diguanylate cyclase (GGDEF)-like protein